jgi:hypothetical protein
VIQIAISQAAFDAIAATLRFGSVNYEAERTEKGEVHIWLEERWLDKLAPSVGFARRTATVIFRLRLYVFTLGRHCCR